MKGCVNTTEFENSIHFKPDDTSFPSIDIRYLYASWSFISIYDPIISLGAPVKCLENLASTNVELRCFDTNAYLISSVSDIILSS